MAASTRSAAIVRLSSERPDYQPQAEQHAAALELHADARLVALVGREAIQPSPNPLTSGRTINGNRPSVDAVVGEPECVRYSGTYVVPVL